MATIASVNTGNSGTLFIDDDGVYIRLYIENRGTQTFANGKAWSVSFSGIGNDGGTFNIGKGYTKIQVGGAYAPGYSQTVTFTMGATGTTGLGGPTSVSANIFRATIPGTPGTPTISEVMPQSMRLTWTIPGNGGAAIDQMLLRRSTDPNFGTYTDHPQGGGVTTAVVSGLTPGVVYYWRVYAHNAVGYSPASGDSNARTLSGFKAWNGTAWKPTILRAWDGSQFKVCILREWDGTQWKVCG
ncbi:MULTISPECIES: fibronectin type III domain-containing protein [unclassified Microbacterium]|uniref:fibronectin type III domain-containing protein n=1 Tax=unclassified Microbacterium TaxID=2609290 RepID=UPI0004934BE0|nr:MULTISPECIES: fibronectin type III domain-containing protein [unclassified Microbacterium]